MSDILPFTPGRLIKITATSTTAAYTLPAATLGRQIFVYNAGVTAIVFALGAATAVVPDTNPATAGTGAFVVAPGTTQTFTVGDQTSLAYITDGATSSIFYLMTGMGE